MRPLFDWLDAHPQSYWFAAGASTLLLVSWIGMAIRRESRRSGPPGAGMKWGDAAVLFLFLLAWRWPFLLMAEEFNPDESQLVAGANALARDPVFWRSVDGSTSGPLNFYVLLPLHWLGAAPVYFGARLTGLLLVFGALLCCWRALAGEFGRVVAWLGMLPVLGFFATATHPDLIHYSSEHLSLFLMALAAWLLAARPPGDHRRLWAACAIAGCLPWAKLQSVPLSLVLIGWGLWQAIREPGAAPSQRWRRAAGAGLAAIAPTVLAAVLIAATGQMETVVRRYFVLNLTYVDAAQGLGSALRLMATHARVDGRLPLLLVTTLVLVLAAAIFFAIRRRRPPTLFVTAGVLSLVAAFTVVAPRREALHYALYLPVPLALWLGAAAGGWWQGLASPRSRLVLAMILFLVGGLPAIFTRAAQPLPAICGRFAYHWDHPRPGAALVIRELAGRDDYLAIWGWAGNLYVGSGLPQAMRDANVIWSIRPHAQRDYFRSCYLADLRRHEPAVFVDAVGPKAFRFENRLTDAHENFPELAEYVRQNYTLVTDLGTARIYARNGWPGSRHLSPTRLNELLAQGYGESYFDITREAAAAPDALKRQIVAERPVAELPALPVAWPLAVTAREVSFEYVCDSVVDEASGRLEARLNVQLVDNPYAQPLYGRVLDPVRRPGDRGFQFVRLVLPPFSPGALLLLQAVPGSVGGPARAPVHVTELQFKHSPGFLPEQFPGFNRVPDLVAAGCTNLKGEGDDRYLVVQPPGFLAWPAAGHERRLRFDCGLEPADPAGAGPGEFLIIRVERHRPGEPVDVVYEHSLRPAVGPAESSALHADISLLNVGAGDRLLLTINPSSGSSQARPWTYVRNLVLE